MEGYHVVVLYGGEEEAQVAEISSNYLYDCLRKVQSQYPELTIERKALKNLDSAKALCKELNNKIKDRSIYVIPCIHGSPGESGEIQPTFEIHNLKYMGSNAEASDKCFDKMKAKSAALSVGVPIVPYLHISRRDLAEKKDKIQQFFSMHNENIFIKATTQGSSIGCYQVRNKKNIWNRLDDAFNYSDNVLIEKAINAREIELAAFTYKDELIISRPGEILTNEEFYDFDKKYSQNSLVKTTLRVKNVDNNQLKLLEKYSRQVFEICNVKDLARIDFFLSRKSGNIYFNEINTFPGLTPISMFPKLLETTGISFEKFLIDKIILKK